MSRSISVLEEAMARKHWYMTAVEEGSSGSLNLETTQLTVSCFQVRVMMNDFVDDGQIMLRRTSSK